MSGPAVRRERLPNDPSSDQSRPHLE